MHGRNCAIDPPLEFCGMPQNSTSPHHCAHHSRQTAASQPNHHHHAPAKRCSKPQTPLINCEDDLIPAVDKDVPPFSNSPPPKTMSSARVNTTSTRVLCLRALLHRQGGIQQLRQGLWSNQGRPRLLQRQDSEQEAHSRDTSTAKVGCP